MEKKSELALPAARQWLASLFPPLLGRNCWRRTVPFPHYVQRGVRERWGTAISPQLHTASSPLNAAADCVKDRSICPGAQLWSPTAIAHTFQRLKAARKLFSASMAIPGH